MIVLKDYVDWEVYDERLGEVRRDNSGETSSVLPTTFITAFFGWQLFELLIPFIMFAFVCASILLITPCAPCFFYAFRQQIFGFARGNGIHIMIPLERVRETLLHRCTFFKLQTHEQMTALVERRDVACPVCLGDWQMGDELCKSPCDHIYHKECVEKWAQFGGASCPVCRCKFDEAAGTATANSSSSSSRNANANNSDMDNARFREPLMSRDFDRTSPRNLLQDLFNTDDDVYAAFDSEAEGAFDSDPFNDLAEGSHNSLASFL